MPAHLLVSDLRAYLWGLHTPGLTTRLNRIASYNQGNEHKKAQGTSYRDFFFHLDDHACRYNFSRSSAFEK
jgi:hypothetical protein